MAAKKTRRKTPEPTLRHVWLAGLGLIAVARREAVGAANDALGKLQSARRQAEAMAGQAQRDVLSAWRMSVNTAKPAWSASAPMSKPGCSPCWPSWA